MSARQQVAGIATVLRREVPFAETGRPEARDRSAAVFGEAAADAVLDVTGVDVTGGDVTGGDVNAELLAVRDTVTRVTGAPARTFRQWAEEHAGAFR
ncbi:hypothetical protein BU197_06310 [Streptomyces sp. CBMA291]|nr:hypothetical protein [Streptomyces sp. CBMA291]MBD0715880.1 hypothetical protein [Streptomyces sp. CBMA370]